MAQTIKVGIIGCGNISGAYFKTGQAMDVLEIVACADINMEAARAKAAAHHVRAMTVEELLADPDIRIVINLTVPGAHGEVGVAALMFPQPVRGKRNEPAFVAHTAKVVAEASGMSVDELASRTTENGLRLFRIADPPKV